ncbi:cell division control protein 4 [Phlyctochytrium arcticum]|nr:cell division control protein 4 [Phlyctochytrium arcticum]
MLPSPTSHRNRGPALTRSPLPTLATIAPHSTAPASTTGNPTSGVHSNSATSAADNVFHSDSRPGASGSGSASSSTSRVIRKPGSQFALAAQQVITTVVTTTTTRTTDFPPVFIPQPPAPHPLDPEIYPLSKIETPPALKRFCFDHNGIPTNFREIEGSKLLEKRLTKPSGAATTVTSTVSRQLLHGAAASTPSPVSGVNSNLIDSELEDLVLPPPRTSRKRPISPEGYPAMTATEVEQGSIVSQPFATPTESRVRANKRRGPLGVSAALQAEMSGSGAQSDRRIPNVNKPFIAGGSISIPLTPFPEANGVEIPGASQSNDPDPNESVTPNLPSPTMSPTIHAAHPSHALNDGNRHNRVSNALTTLASHGLDPGFSSMTFTEESQLPAELADLPSLGDIPYILQTFDTLPAQLKSYLLLQLLRRCPFPTLQFVSSLILPSLKRDFIGLLPVELSYQVMQYLDLRSLGRCASVSKAWKRVVDGDGAEVAVWKRRLTGEGWYDEEEVRIEANLDNVMEEASTSDPMDESDTDFVRAKRTTKASRTRVTSRSDWPEDWEAWNLATSSRQKGSTDDSLENHQLPPQTYKTLYRRHHLIRQNWFHGRYKHISFPGHAFNVVTALQFDAEKIVSGSDDQTIHIYDTASGELRKRLRGHEGGVWALQYWNDVLVSGSTDRTVRVWDMETGRCTQLFEGHTSTVRCLSIIIPWRNPETGRMEPEVPLIVTGSRDATLRVWRLPHPKRDRPYLPTTSGASSPAPGEANPNPFFKYVLKGHSDSVRAIAGFANVLVSGSYDCHVRIWNLSTGSCDHICRGHREKVYSVGYSHELRRAVSGSMDATVRVWCTRTGQAMFTLEGHSSLVGLLELSPQYLVSAAADATLRIWSPTTGQCLANLTGHSAAITCFHHDPKFNRIVSGSDGGVKVWELSSTDYGSGQPPPGAPFTPSLAFTQGPNGAQPVHGRFIRDLVGNVQGVWRVRMDEQRLVCAVQREQGRTWFEVLDFTEGLDIGTKVEGPGDRFAPADTSEEDEEEEEDGNDYAEEDGNPVDGEPDAEGDDADMHSQIGDDGDNSHAHQHVATPTQQDTTASPTEPTSDLHGQGPLQSSSVHPTSNTALESSSASLALPLTSSLQPARSVSRNPAFL